MARPKTYEEQVCLHMADARPEIFTAVKDQVEVFWAVTPCGVVVGDRLIATCPQSAFYPITYTTFPHKMRSMMCFTAPHEKLIHFFHQKEEI